MTYDPYGGSSARKLAETVSPDSSVPPAYADRIQEEETRAGRYRMLMQEFSGLDAYHHNNTVDIPGLARKLRRYLDDDADRTRVARDLKRREAPAVPKDLSSFLNAPTDPLVTLTGRLRRIMGGADRTRLAGMLADGEDADARPSTAQMIGEALRPKRRGKPAGEEKEPIAFTTTGVAENWGRGAGAA